MYIEDDRYINIYNVAIGRGRTLFKFQSLNHYTDTSQAGPSTSTRPRSATPAVRAGRPVL